jgi:hypothetical protein
MQPSHAAALALAGWYLMVPPAHPHRTDAGKLVAPDVEMAPLSEWAIARSYDTATECMVERDARTTIARRHKWSGKEQDLDQAESDLQSLTSVCISTDDLRLKGR